MIPIVRLNGNVIPNVAATHIPMLASGIATRTAARAARSEALTARVANTVAPLDDRPEVIPSHPPTPGRTIAATLMKGPFRFRSGKRIAASRPTSGTKNATIGLKALTQRTSDSAKR